MFAESERVDGGDHRVVAPLVTSTGCLIFFESAKGSPTDLAQAATAPAGRPPPLQKLDCSYLLSAVPAVAQTGAPPLD
jgi:hypothetical protein